MSRSSNCTLTHWPRLPAVVRLLPAAAAGSEPTSNALCAKITPSRSLLAILNAVSYAVHAAAAALGKHQHRLAARQQARHLVERAARFFGRPLAQDRNALAEVPEDAHEHVLRDVVLVRQVPGEPGRAHEQAPARGQRPLNHQRIDQREVVRADQQRSPLVADERRELRADPPPSGNPVAPEPQPPLEAEVREAVSYTHLTLP